MRRVLAIDGGGIKGVFPASFLKTVEESIGKNPGDYFDLIVGTSTGGIIALGLGLGLSASRILDFYVKEGPTIFGGNRILRFLRHFGLSKYDNAPLRRALEGAFGTTTLGASKKRLVIPSSNLDTGEVHIWKTAHHARLERDYAALAVDAAMATSAAPSYFPVFRSHAGSPLVDGGLWANNPVGLAVVEAVGILGWAPSELHVLSLGCTTTPLDIRSGQRWPLGWGYWTAKLLDVIMKVQSSASLGTAQHLVPNRDNIVRISPEVSGRFGLDTCREIESLCGLGDSEARKALPSLRPRFFTEPAEPFVPLYGK